MLMVMQPSLSRHVKKFLKNIKTVPHIKIEFVILKHPKYFMIQAVSENELFSFGIKKIRFSDIRKYLLLI